MSEAVVVPVERGSWEPFDPVRISPSRVNAYLQCGQAFRRKYILGERPKVIGSAALFGNVMHGALEKWALNRDQSLVSLTAQSWLELTKGTPVAKFLGEYQAISVECMKAERAAADAFERRNPGKKSKAPRMTKEFKESAAAQKLNALLARWLDALNEGSKWRFTERDPLPNLYDESLKVAKRYSRKWSDLPAALHTEFGFTVEWRGFILNGFIDTIEPVLDDGELIGYVVGDYKSYRAEAPLAKDHRQGVIYDIAFDSLCRSGALPFDPDLPRWIVFDYLRLLERKDFVMGEADHDVLFADLTMYRKGVEAEVFLPAHKNQNPDFCDFPEDCCMKTRGDGTGCRGGLYPETTDAAD